MRLLVLVLVLALALLLLLRGQRLLQVLLLRALLVPAVLLRSPIPMPVAARLRLNVERAKACGALRAQRQAMTTPRSAATNEERE